VANQPVKLFVAAGAGETASVYLYVRGPDSVNGNASVVGYLEPAQ
jgi:hypothetical protein